MVSMLTFLMKTFNWKRLKVMFIWLEVPASKLPLQDFATQLERREFVSSFQDPQIEKKMGLHLGEISTRATRRAMSNICCSTKRNSTQVSNACFGSPRQSVTSVFQVRRWSTLHWRRCTSSLTLPPMTRLKGTSRLTQHHSQGIQYVTNKAFVSLLRQFLI